MEKLKWCGYPTEKKNFVERFSRRVTDGQTDILPQHSPRYAKNASRGKNL